MPTQNRTRTRKKQPSRVKTKRLPDGTVLHITVYDKPKRRGR